MLNEMNAVRANVIIKGEKVILTECARGLWHKFFKDFISDPAINANPYVYNYENVEKDFHIKTSDPTRLFFFIIRKNKLIGQIYLKHMDMDKKTTEIGVSMTSNFVKGRGYGTEAVELLIDYAFNVLGFEKIFADTLLQNIRSQHILQKLGFVFIRQDSNFRCYELLRDNK